MKDLIIKSIKDFLSPYMLKLTFLPIVCLFVFWAVIFYYFSYDLFVYLFSFVDVSFTSSWLTWLEYVLDWLSKVAIFLLLFVLFFVFILFSNLIVCSFLAPLVVKHTKDKHYGSIELLEDSNLVSIFSLLKIYVLYLFVLLVCIPIYFIPVLGACVLLFINYWFFTKCVVFDVGSIIVGVSNLKQIESNNKRDIRILGGLLYGASLIPFLNFVVPFFSLIVFSHLIFTKKSQG